MAPVTEIPKRWTSGLCDTIMGHIMKSATVRDLRYRFSELEAHLRQGEEIEIRKRKRVVGRLVPVHRKASAYPDFAARTRKIFGDKVMSVTGADLVSWGRAE
jgi:antitoxin (DNA-binding transcriptional repressor) of toxin-antitoxin stability system